MHVKYLNAGTPQISYVPLIVWVFIWNNERKHARKIPFYFYFVRQVLIYRVRIIQSFYLFNSICCREVSRNFFQRMIYILAHTLFVQMFRYEA